MNAPQLSTALTSFAAEDPGDWEPMLQQAQALDEAGFDRLVVSDHVVFGERLEEYARPEIGGQAGGKQPTGPDGHWLEPLTTLAVIAGRTSRIRLGTNILIAALRRPAVMAKSAATLDVLSGGRLDLGVGVGWQREEYEAAGLPFEGRGRLLDETLRVCRTLWTETTAAYDSPGLSFERIHMMPKPRQPGGVPIWVSGTVNGMVARRLAEFGSGWIPWGEAAADPVSGIRRMGELLSGLGRDIGDVQVVGTLPVKKSADGGFDLPATMARVPEMRQAGISDFRVWLRVPTDRSQAVDQLTPLVEAFRDAST
ncbi:MAG TPA: TIGR03619 family F420-dependent LLM class oxidoreductase [Acidimicrobiales bacterium]|nr:TIGR03619 family F420-dependent LLM class oxidoreductase [Acidimicrobiales bacterium]